MKTLPKNVLAVIAWYKEHMPSSAPDIEWLFNLEQKPTELQEAMIGLILQGFEAGREFQKAHPEVESGIGYL